MIKEDSASIFKAVDWGFDYCLYEIFFIISFNNVGNEDKNFNNVGC